MRLLHDLVEMFREIGINGFRGHEQNRQILRLAGDQVFLRNILHVFQKIALHALRGPRAILVRARFAKGRKTLERKLGVHRQQTLVARQADHAIGPRARRQRPLEIVGTRWQAIAHDRLHPALPICAARLLVGENVLETHHFLRQPVQPRLRGVDHGKAFVQLAEILALRARGLLQPLADAVLHIVEPLGHKTREIRLARPQHFGDRLHAPGEFRARSVQLRHLVVHLALAFGGGAGLRAARPRRADQDDRDDEQEEQGDRAADQQDVENPDRRAGEDEKNAIHPFCLARFGLSRERIGNISPAH